MSIVAPLGANTFKLVKAPLTLGNQSGRTPVTILKLKNQYILVSAFSYSVPTWPGSSFVIARTQLNTGQNFSLAIPLTLGGNYCPAIYYPSTGERYKLVEDVGEQFTGELYSGGVIPSGVWLEFWSIDDGQPSMTSTDWYVPTTALALPTDWMDRSLTIAYATGVPTQTSIPYA